MGQFSFSLVNGQIIIKINLSSYYVQSEFNNFLEREKYGIDNMYFHNTIGAPMCYIRRHK